MHAMFKRKPADRAARTDDNRWKPSAVIVILIRTALCSRSTRQLAWPRLASDAAKRFAAELRAPRTWKISPLRMSSPGFQQNRFAALNVSCQTDAHYDEGECGKQVGRHRAIDARPDQRVGFDRGSRIKVHCVLLRIAPANDGALLNCSLVCSRPGRLRPHQPLGFDPEQIWFAGRAVCQRIIAPPVGAARFTIN